LLGKLRHYRTCTAKEQAEKQSRGDQEMSWLAHKTLHDYGFTDEVIMANSTQRYA